MSWSSGCRSPTRQESITKSFYNTSVIQMTPTEPARRHLHRPRRPDPARHPRPAHERRGVGERTGRAVLDQPAGDSKHLKILERAGLVSRVRRRHPPAGEDRGRPDEGRRRLAREIPRVLGELTSGSMPCSKSSRRPSTPRTSPARRKTTAMPKPLTITTPGDRQIVVRGVRRPARPRLPLLLEARAAAPLVRHAGLDHAHLRDRLPRRRQVALRPALARRLRDGRAAASIPAIEPPERIDQTEYYDDDWTGADHRQRAHPDRTGRRHHRDDDRHLHLARSPRGRCRLADGRRHGDRLQAARCRCSPSCSSPDASEPPATRRTR